LTGTEVWSDRENGIKRESEANPIIKPRRRPKQPGVEREPAVKPPAPRSRGWENTYTHSPHLQRLFRATTPFNTGNVTAVSCFSDAINRINAMRDELREYLAHEFASVMRVVREKKWKIFKAAAKQTDLDSYVALSRILVRIVEEAIDNPAPPINPSNN